MLKVRILREAADKLTPIQQYNADYLMKKRSVEPSMNELGIYDMQDYHSLVRNIPVLGRAKITKFITGRSFGKLFKLDNDRIFKMFASSLDPFEDMEWYKKCYDDLHSGNAKKTTLPVFDVGEWDGPQTTIYWVEMAEVIPFDKWAEETGRWDNNRVWNEFMAVVEFAERNSARSIIEFAKWLGNEISPYTEPAIEEMYRMLLGKENNANMTKKEIVNLIEALQDLKADGFKMKDVLPRNVGILKQSRPDNPTFIIFDN